ncbi:MAG: GHKL domain-containing protein [Candidatus Cyclonatronum sp.]|uniref:sensor histidine kinase n=1 Tax=Cyclonatronum sp. TaxID=3024185 RepID=UPI0025C5ADDF|nr:sensor histidine kinase [Cyclonatronum sp.]MCH8486015.1 GHKL domain-containing protein [Cyclonatronum sp.]
MTPTHKSKPNIPLPFFWFVFLSGLSVLSCQSGIQDTQPAPAHAAEIASGFKLDPAQLQQLSATEIRFSNFERIEAGPPEIHPALANIYQSGIPDVITATAPAELGLADEGEHVEATHTTIRAGLPETVIARDMASRDHNPANISSFGKLQGLRQNNVVTLTQDNYGNLWFGTAGGLTRFDGSAFSHYDTEQGLLNNFVRFLFTDSRGHLWIGSEGGVSRYDGLRFTHYTTQNGLINNAVISITEDTDGRMWFGTRGGGISVLDGDSFIHYTANDVLTGNVVWHLLRDSKGVIWAAIRGGGIVSFKEGTFRHYGTEHGLAHNAALFLYEDRDGNLWTGTEGGGVSKFDGQQFRNYGTAQGLSNDVVMSVTQDASGNMWFGTLQGLSRYDGSTFMHISEAHGLKSDVVFTLLTDKTGNLWMGTRSGGLSRYNGDVFSHFTTRDGLSMNVIVSSLQDSRGRLWFGTEGGGISRFNKTDDGNRAFFEHIGTRQGLSMNNVMSLHEDRFGRIWIGTAGGGTHIYDNTRPDREPEIIYVNVPGYSLGFVFDIYEDRNGTLWFGTTGGVVRFEPAPGSNGQTGRFTQIGVAEGLSSDNVFSITEDRRGTFWFGTSGGLTRFTPDIEGGEGRFYHYSMDNGLTSNLIWSVFEDSNGIVWLGTQSGITAFLPENQPSETAARLVRITEQQGLINNDVRNILEDTNGNLWFGSSFGLSVLSPLTTRTLLARLTSGTTQADEVFFRNFSYEDGFLGIGNFRNTILEDDEGLIWIGSGDRLTVHYPASEARLANIPAPNIQLTGIELFNEQLDWMNPALEEGRTIELANGIEVRDVRFSGLSPWYHLPEQLSLAFNNNFMSFNYAGISMHQTHRIKYRYKLEGMDTNWNPVTERTTAPYGNVPPGRYTFRVKAMNSDGLWSEELTFPFIIRPPWWQTIWAYSFYTLFFAGTLFGLVQFERRRLVEKERERAREKELEQAREIEIAYKNLKATQDQLIQQEKLASLGQLTAGIAHEIKNPLNFVNNFSELSIELIEEIYEELEKLGESDTREEIEDILGDIKSNLEKIYQHGSRADGIVKSMLLHSRGGSGKTEPANLNSIIQEYMNLAFHGMKAGKNPINVGLKKELDENMGDIPLITEDFSRVLINMYNNAFDAMREKVTNEGENGYQPLLTVRSRKTENRAVIEIEDNGPGIPEELKNKILQPFFTTKKGTQGTGLGLSITNDIVKAHGGEIRIEKPADGTGTRFVISIPASQI